MRSKQTKKSGTKKSDVKKTSSKKPKLVKITRSPNKTKKLRAYFSNGKHTDFGASGYSDYTIHKDDDRKDRYIARHKKREDWNNPTKAGTLSRYILWNKKSLKASISDFKKRF